ncbi:MAG TPA: SRPBCC domain-containing protein [Actinomycetota bacterium]|nr:SRPBCC domain-containing protein [Actinomycetota bacterium]
MRTVTVSRPVEEAFRIFTEETGAWWPLDTHSRAAAGPAGEGVKAETVVIEGRGGGRIYEVMSDGTEASWGEVVGWEPPYRVVFSWKPNLREEPPTEVEVTFTEHDAGTRVDLVHRGWERLGEAAVEAREEYTQGWPRVLAAFERAQ